MKFPKTINFFLALLFLFLFALLSKYEDRVFLRNLDFAVTVKVQDKIYESVGFMMEGATFFASPEFTVIVTLVLTAFSFHKTKRALLIPILLALLVAIEIYAKSVVHHPSPPFSMIKNPTTMFPANYVNEQFSYPSGHAARAVFLAVIVFFSMRKRVWIGVSLGLYVLFVSVSRVYLGHHWFSDVVGGLLLGSSLGIMSFTMSD